MKTEIDKKYLLSSYNFDVPPENVAQSPADRRECSKLYEKKGLEEKSCFFYDLDTLLPEGALVVLNETKVFSCRLEAKNKTRGKIEVFLLESPSVKNSSMLEALAKPFKKIKEGMTLSFASGVSAEVVSKLDQNKLAKIMLQFNLEARELDVWLAKEGRVPLPPYIKREKGPSSDQDQSRYQTVYAKKTGSVAAPTAGLHFTEEVIAKLKRKNIDFAKVTLHVGLGTFLPIKEEEILKHEMHSETYQVPKESLAKIEKAKKEGRKIIMVGTTSLRCLESFYLKAQKESLLVDDLADKWLKTNLFIYPKKDGTLYKPQVGDALLTNFHQPCSSLFVLISALLGREEVLTMYQRALKKDYRFYSYGDSSLLWL